VSVLLLLALQDIADTKGKVPWLDESAKAFAASKETGKPVFIFFGCC
jgi:hypothetical protein